MTPYEHLHELIGDVVPTGPIEERIATLASIARVAAADLTTRLQAMTPVELSATTLTIEQSLVPQLAVLLARFMGRPDGELYNAVTWPLGSDPEVGTLELILQRTEGETPTQARDRLAAELATAQARAIDPTTARIAAEMLDLAGNEFSNHGCNDYKLPNTPEHLAFVQRLIAAGDYPDDTPHISDDRTAIYLMDWKVMGYCEDVLRQVAGGEEP